jgi:hypothetical protein
MQASTLTQDSTVHARRLRVALVCMPFYAAGTASIQIGLLSALARREGCAADTFHLNLELAARLTPEVYEFLCNHRGRMTGDWLFSVAAFGAHVSGDDAAYFSEFSGDIANLNNAIGKDEAYLTALRHEVLPAFIEDCLQATDWGAYDLVGFTSTFQQNVASLALARRTKRRIQTSRSSSAAPTSRTKWGSSTCAPSRSSITPWWARVTSPFLLCSRRSAAVCSPRSFPAWSSARRANSRLADRLRQCATSMRCRRPSTTSTSTGRNACS